MNKCIILEISEIKAKKIWSKTFTQNCFTDPTILKYLNYEIKYFLIHYKDIPIIFWPTIIKENNIIVPNNFYYVGPTLMNEYYKLSNHSKVSVLKETLECGVGYFKNKFKKMHFQVHPTFNDIRFFLWETEFKINVKYSAFLKPHNNYLNFWRDLRKRQIKKITKIQNKIYVDNIISVEEIIDLANDTIKISNLNLNEYINVEFFAKLYQKKLGKVICVREKESKKLLSFCYIIEDQKSINLVYNFALQEWKNIGVMQLNISEIIKYCIERDKTLDFNGANSFIGADDKASYGAEEKIYFSINDKNS
tara:strand:- start:1398 stop:2318 length:921 start_codon:yes stop_codon:yes gene_type:complete